MIEINITTAEDGYMKIEAKGHAQSVVCASVSTLLQSSVRFLQDLSAQYPEDVNVIIKEEQ
ncbi:ribosomal-processing cysteine protease Prp [Cytobacillus oceanisediminis]|uniref:Ribosomal processing cysteine protease Prp n=1 Tax=Cytobacillus oceanisediminis 2691 TaxID=1196031 RepID=A0A160M8V7_9BACI|nr:ribosomal-processing cysteine protease Prp [Cytobacillus oceanisediminis]AND39042.1 hypothetical protein A361_07895 [Cytobacillus oceanisediminis 2691]USK44642.1 ribosomal-processing cysteine protease Prp [Cytobacillus oceanisediminis]